MRSFITAHGAVLAALFMAVLLTLYMLLAGWQGILMVVSGQPVAVAMGIALLIFPIVGVWALIAELRFGKHSSDLAGRLTEDDVHELAAISDPQTGRPGRTKAVLLIADARAACVAYPESWRKRMVYSLTLDASGKRGLARAAAREAIKLSRTSTQRGDSEHPNQTLLTQRHDS